MKPSSCRVTRSLLIQFLVTQLKALVPRIISFHRSSFAAERGHLSLAAAMSTALTMAAINAVAQPAIPTLTDPDLAVRTVVSGLMQPIGIAFLGPARQTSVLRSLEEWNEYLECHVAADFPMNLPHEAPTQFVSSG